MLIWTAHNSTPPNAMRTKLTQPRPLAFTLIEMLIVITIIGILAGISVPVVGGVMERARKLKALSTIKDLQVAFKSYQTEYNRYPSTATASDTVATTNASDNFVSILQAQTAGDPLNPRGIKFVDLPLGKSFRAGQFRGGLDDSSPAGLFDEWGQPYQVTLDTNYDEKVSNPDKDNEDTNISTNAPVDLPLGVAIYSLGPDGDPNGKNQMTPTKDDITSWRGY